MLALPATAHAAQAWWEPLAFAGQRVTSVIALPGEILVNTSSGTFLSGDNGHSFQPLSPHRHVALPLTTGPRSEEHTSLFRS